MSGDNPIRSADVAFRAVEDEMLLVSARQGRGLSVNQVGARVWELADGSRSSAEIVKSVQADFEVDPGIVERDVLSFLADLADRGFLDWPEEDAVL